jgi:L-ribulose-5-phosphate 3-epimerase
MLALRPRDSVAKPRRGWMEVVVHWKIGVIVDSLKLGVRAGVRKAAEIGANGVQLYVTEGELAPERMSHQDRADFRRFVQSCGLEISALCGDLFKGFLNHETNPFVVRRSRDFVDLAVDLGVTIVTTHIGKLPQDTGAQQWGWGVSAVQEVARYAEERGCRFAMETGPEEPALLLQFLERIQGKGIAVNYDPANLIMSGPFDHIGGVYILKDYIVHTHAKDGVCLRKRESPAKNLRLEVPLGEGSVAFRYYLKALSEIGYTGYLTVEREVGDDPVSDIGKAVAFLRSLEELA